MGLNRGWCLRTLVLLIAACATSRGEVVINELMASGAERTLRWSAAGVPTLGFGTPWQAGDFNDSTWQTGPGPFGFGSFTNVSPTPPVGTSTATQMQNLTPTLYLRKSFSVSAADAAKTDPLNLEVRFNDGFVCYLNGVEVARRNAGPPNGFVYHDQTAAFGTPATTEPSTTPYLRTETIFLGAANTRLIAGTNVLAVHALNFWEATTLHNTTTNAIVGVTNSSNFYFKGDLKIASTVPVILVSSDSIWRYQPGLVEPSGGVYDPTLLLQGKLNVPWGRTSFDDSLWSKGATPIGAGTPPSGVTLGTNLTTQIPGLSTSLYTRIVFTATTADLADPKALQLLVDWDDGFVAYLNGVEVSRDRMDAANSFTPHDAVASTARTPGSYATYNLDPPARLLVAGSNVLAVQVHNVALADPDLFFRAQLRTNSAGTNRTLVNAVSTWNYFIGTEEPLPPVDESIEDNPDPPDSSYDWVELHNNGAAAVLLGGWKLSDKATDPGQWSFPSGTVLPAGGFLLVACDGLNLTAPSAGGMLHTNFKLDAAGESVVLADPSGAIVQQVNFGQQSAFQSFGRNGGGSYGFFDPPSPGAANSGSFLAGQVAPVTFSVPAGFLSGSRTITMATATPGATIRYSTDGSEPTETTGTAATSVTLSTSRSIRARAFKTGMLPSATATRTYLINEPTARQSVPAICLTAEEQRTFYRPHGVMSISGGSYPKFISPAPLTMNDQWTQASGTVGGTADLAAYDHAIIRGKCMERAANFEMLYSDGRQGPNTGFGLRVSGSGHARPRYKLSNQNRAPGASPAANDGAWSSTDFTQKPSFNFFFRNDFGQDPLESPLFEGGAVTSFHDLRLRAGKNDVSNPFIEDEYMRRLFLSTGQVGSHGSINTLYLNGVYKGYFNLCEHIREDFLQRYHHSDLAWDVRQVTTIASGDGLAFQEMITFLRNNPQSALANYRGMTGRLDMENFIDYLLVNLVGVTGDWPHNNFVCARERSVNGRHRYYLWDAEGAFGDFSGTVRTNMFQASTTAIPPSIVTTTPATVSLAEGIRILYTLLRASPEFKLLFADRIQRHFYQNGVLTNSRMLADWNALKSQFAPLIAPTAVNDKVTPWLNGIGDATRYTTSGTTTVNAPSRRNVLFNGYYDDTTGGAWVTGHLAAEGLWPATQAPVFQQHGGSVPSGYSLSISNPNSGGTIRFTTNGLDPRAEGGAIVGASYTGPITILYPTTVKARVLSAAGEWSPLAEAFFDTATIEPLLLTEIMYHPPDQGATSGNQYEFLEIKNPTTTTIHLGGMRFTDGIDYTFPPDTMIGAGECLVLARSSARFHEKYPAVTPAGEWGQSTALENAGETVTLVNSFGRAVFQVTYGDQAPWPSSPDGDGNSLVPVQPNSNPAPSDPAYWRASTNLGGSPGSDDPAPVVSPVLITELMANPVPPETDRIELHNPNPFPVNVGHWWVSNSGSTVQKFRIPADTTIPAGGFLVIHETDFAAGAIPFGFSSNGETARLSSGDITGTLTGYSHSVDFGASSPGESHGRYVNSQGGEFFLAMTSPTFGATNSQPRVGPVVLSELMYSPAANGDEFIELRNPGKQPVDLFDPDHPANTWRIDGVGWSFPAGTTLQPGQMILLSNLTPSAFRTKYQVPAAIEVFGGYPGNLNNGGETITLQKPGVPYQNATLETVVPYIDIDRVSYTPSAPWPVAANGGGPSLERINPQAFADDPINWQASPVSGGTPGTPSAQTFGTWSGFFFTPAQLANPLTGASSADPDGDGLVNLREWAHGLDPWSPDADPVTFHVTHIGGESFCEITVRRSRSANGLGLFADSSASLSAWNLGSGIQIGQPVNRGDGTETVVFRAPSAVGSTPCNFLRIRFTAP